MASRTVSGKRRAPARVANSTEMRDATAAQPLEWRFDNIEALIDSGEGDITIGELASISCIAAAAESGQCLATLVRRPGESLHALMLRLDAAIASAWEDEVYIDEVNAQSTPPPKKTARSRR